VRPPHYCLVHCYRQLQDANLAGALPASLANCTRLKVLDVTNNSLTGLPSAPLPASLTHVYLGVNQLNGSAAELGHALGSVSELAALEVSLLNVGLSLGASSDYTRVSPPTGCRVGPSAPPCTFTLRLYDNTYPAQPARVGGLVHGLELGNATGYGGRVPMVDNRDGSFSGTVNQSWVSRRGPHTFTVWLGGRDISAGLKYDATGAHKDDNATSVALRTVDFGPIECAAHMHPDSAGATCLCDTNFTLEAGGQSCHRQCPGGTKVRLSHSVSASSGGTHC
jgi:hypothetical protein